MKTHITDTTVLLFLSKNDTYNWATRSGRCWPCSQLSGNRMTAEFDDGGLIDCSVNGRDADIEADELSAICADHLADRLPVSHPAYDVAVSQHLAR